jgi:Zn-dependent protease
LLREKMPRYIRTNTLKQTFMEDLRIVRSWKVILLWVPKLFRRRLEFGSAYPVPVPFQDFVVASERIIPTALGKFAGPLEEAARLGFLDPVYQEAWTLARESIITVANLRHSGGETVARFMHVRLGTVHPPHERMTTSLLTRFADGRLLVTTDQHASLNSAPNVISQRRVGASLGNLLTLHQARLEELRRQAAPVRMLDDSAMAAMLDQMETEGVENNLRRGLYEEVSPEEVQAQAARVPAVPPIVGVAEPDTAVLAEIERLRNKRGSWKTAITVGLLSFLAFVGLGKVHWSWEFVLLLTGMVLFHELGHYVAMRIFRYADVRMFFVPLLGAAVTGRHYNVKGWQRAVVYLAGPIPGIALGLVLTVAAVVTDNPLVEKAALIALLLNGINLLPFVPLDGGWVLHAILFSRHFVLETAFLGFAGIALMAASWLGQGRFWFYLGLVVLLGLPASYRLAKAANHLKKSGVPTASPDDQNIPPETALAILAELKQGPVAIRSTKHLARQTLEVFQKLNATPPGALASIGFLVVYLGAGAAAFMGTGTILAARLGLLGLGPGLRLVEPPLKVDPNGYRVAGLTNAAEFNPATPVLVATFTNTTEAETAFQTASRAGTANDRVTLFGQSIFVGGPQIMNRWPGWFAARGAETILEQPVSNVMAVVTLTCEAPDKDSAQELEADCDSYLRSSCLKAWPPWADLEGLNPGEIQAIQRIRYTWRRIHDLERAVAADPEFKQLAHPPGLPGRRPNDEVIDTLKKRATLERTLYQRELDKLADSEDAGLEKDLVRFYAMSRSSREGNETAEAPQSLSESTLWKFGSLPNEGSPANPRSWCAAIEGAVHCNKLKLTFSYLTFYRTDFGLPALASYLQRHGCREFRYKLEEP